jgi:hypothetical protein
MVFFHFGRDSSSWAAGNECFSFANNLGGDLKRQWDQLGALFHDKSMAGTRIEWLSTAPDGSYCLAERNGTSMHPVHSVHGLGASARFPK